MVCYYTIVHQELMKALTILCEAFLPPRGTPPRDPPPPSKYTPIFPNTPPPKLACFVPPGGGSRGLEAQRTLGVFNKPPKREKPTENPQNP